MAKKLDISGNTTPTYMELSFNIAKPNKEKAKEKLQELIKEETKMVKGIFQCFETPGSTTKITVRKYPGIPHFEQTMTDGEIYEVPLYVARHLNGVDVSAGALGGNPQPNIGTCSYPVHGFLWKNGAAAPASQPGMGGNFSGVPVPIVGVAKRVKRFGFQSLEFGSPIE